MARRGENIYKRKDGRWEGRYIKGRRLNGKIIYGYIYNQKYFVVKQQLIQLKSAYKHEKNCVVYSETVELWLEEWLNEVVYNRVKASTFASYQHKIKHYICPYLGKEIMQGLSSNKIQSWIKNLEEKKLSATTIRLVFRIFKMASKAAQKKNILQHDLTENVIIPKSKKKKIYALSITEQKRIEQEASKKGIQGASVFLALYTGMRIGEISALKWTDVDFSRGIIYVQRTLQRIPLKKGICKTQLITQCTKSEESQRIIPFSAQLKNYLLLLKKQSKSLFVVGTKEKALEPRAITYHFKKILKKINLAHIHFHQLRHTFATRALEIGGDITSISDLLGHHSPKFTLEVYTHSLLHQKKKLTQKLERQFFSFFK